MSHIGKEELFHLKKNHWKINSRVPLKVQVVGRYLFLGESNKGRREHIKQIEKEVTSLWQKKLNFPNLSIQIVHAKLDQVLKTYNKCVKQGKYDH